MVSIRNIRKALGLSQKEFAKMLNVHQTAVSQWETNKTSPDIDTLRRIADKFGVSVDALLGVSKNETIEFLEDGSFSVSSRVTLKEPLAIKLVKSGPDESEVVPVIVRKDKNPSSSYDDGIKPIDLKNDPLEEMMNDEFTLAMYNESKELTEEQKDLLLGLARQMKNKE